MEQGRRIVERLQGNGLEEPTATWRNFLGVKKVDRD